MKTEIYATGCLKEIEAVWRSLMPASHLFNNWDVRLAFHNAFQREPLGIIARRDNMPVGILPLSFIPDAGYYGYFPGETWQDKTWLEQNIIPYDRPDLLRLLWDAAPFNTNLRYLRYSSASNIYGFEKDEYNYFIHPGRYHYNMDNFFQSFNGKSRKKIFHEINRYEESSTRILNGLQRDIDWMISENLKTFGDLSYFADRKFQKGFSNLIDFLVRINALIIFKIEFQGKVAAVDVGALYKNTYTIIAGAVDREFPGISKIINLHHIRWGFNQKFWILDFLCGDFNWKKRFRLMESPLFRVHKGSPAVSRAAEYCMTETVFESCSVE